MTFEHISSKSNDKIKRVNLLTRSASARRENNLFVLEGLRLCRDAMQFGITIDELYFTQKALDKFTEDVNNLVDCSTASYCVTEDVMAKISDTENSQGILCVVNKSSVNQNRSLNHTERYIACENISDPSNLGAIARTAEALGIEGMILIGHCCDVYNPKSLRASMGALLRLNIFQFLSPECFIEKTKALSMRSVAAVVSPSAKDITTFKFNDGDIVIIGNEANGISSELLSMCNDAVTIPIKGRAESFNAAVAASIIMWELCK